jgi:hypothetical protein
MQESRTDDTYFDQFVGHFRSDIDCLLEVLESLSALAAFEKLHSCIFVLLTLSKNNVMACKHKIRFVDIAVQSSFLLQQIGMKFRQRH